MKVCCSFTFEAAHFLPYVAESHKCRRVHGHNYKVEVECNGEVLPNYGWVVDFAKIEKHVQPFIDGLDHRLLNEKHGLSNPTAESICQWLWIKVEGALPTLSRIRVWETDRYWAEKTK